MTKLSQSLAESFTALALSHVSREYPNKLDHVLADPADVRGPRALHPVFFGSFDWHSCVHGYWLLARLLLLYPDHRQAGDVKALFCERFTRQAMEVECAYLERASARGFERPYGWAWLLALQSTLDQHPDPALAAAAEVLMPLSQKFASRFKAYLPLAQYPVRTGMHTSSAFALTLTADFAQRHDTALYTLMQERVVHWYWQDQGAQAWEPGQDDFLSPTLMEAMCMQRYSTQAEFSPWFARFLPDIAHQTPASLFTPASVSDRTDGKIAHLDGLNLSRAWCWRRLARSCTSAAQSQQLMQSADEHLNVSLPHVAGDYMGEHWLATFALLALADLS